MLDFYRALYGDMRKLKHLSAELQQAKTTIHSHFCETCQQDKICPITKCKWGIAEVTCLECWVKAWAEL